jgi:hypothetical protein
MVYKGKHIWGEIRDGDHTEHREIPHTIQTLTHTRQPLFFSEEEYEADQWYTTVHHQWVRAARGDEPVHVEGEFESETDISRGEFEIRTARCYNQFSKRKTHAQLQGTLATKTTTSCYPRIDFGGRGGNMWSRDGNASKQQEQRAWPPR